MKKGKTQLFIAIIVLLTLLIGVLVFFIVKGSKKEEGKKQDKQIEITTAPASDTDADTDQEELTTEDASDNNKDGEKSKQNKSCFVTVSKTNGWESAGGYSGQLDSAITNKTATSLNNWKIELTVPEETTVDSSWNATVSKSKTTITITSVDYNAEIPANGSLKDIGIIITVPSENNLAEICKSAKLFIDGKEYSDDTAENKTDKDDKEETTEAVKPAEKVETESGTPFDNHGKLTLSGTDIVDKNGEKYQLKGVSTHGIAWFPQYVNKEAFQSVRDDMGANMIRIAMYSGENNGYCTGGDKNKLKGLVNTGVEAATELGMYVIIDWHVLGDLTPQTYKEEAKEFFREMSGTYKNYDNVIYEICNEPNGGTTWADVKSYAEEVIPIIRENDKDALIIVGTPNWSQDVDIAAQDPVEGYDNIMYAVHFYAATHTDNIRNKVTTALSKGLPIFVSEFSICDASGNGGIDYDQAEKWFDLINDKNLSYAAWSLCNKDETSALIKSSCSKTSGWTDDDLSETGIWLKKTIKGE